MTSSNDEIERAKLIAETAKIPWLELQRFFAAGSVIGVAPELDLVDVACAMAADNKAVVAPWVEAGLVGAVSDTQALEWLDSDALVWAVVLSPWVLVQPVADV